MQQVISRHGPTIPYNLRNMHIYAEFIFPTTPSFVLHSNNELVHDGFFFLLATPLHSTQSCDVRSNEHILTGAKHLRGAGTAQANISTMRSHHIIVTVVGGIRCSQASRLFYIM